MAVYVQFDDADNSYTEGFDSGLSSCELLIQTGLPAGLALTQSNSLFVVGALADGTTELRVFNDLSTRGNSSLDQEQDYVIPLSGMVQPEGMLYAGLGKGGALSVTADAGSGSASTVPGLHASFLQASSSSVLGKYVTVNQKGTNGPVWNTAYDSKHDRLFAASTSGVVTVFDSFEKNVSKGKTPKASRTITPGAVSKSGRGSQISGALHGIAYDAKTDTLVIADFDNAALYVIKKAGKAKDSSSGGGTKVVVPDRIVSGGGTSLLAPTDAQLAADGSLYVADQGANGSVLRYENFLAGTSSTPAPDAVATGMGGLPAFLALVSPAS